MQVIFGKRLAVKEQVKEKGSTSNEGFKVELPNLVCTFVLHECRVLCWEHRKKVEALIWSFYACMIKPLVLFCRRDLPPTKKLVTIMGISWVFWGYFFGSFKLVLSPFF
jgi:hypothetical protein